MERSKYNISVIEDDPLIGSLVAWNLNQSSEYEVKLFASAEEFLKEKVFRSDIVVLDYELNGEKGAMNGFQMLDKLKDTPVIIMSAQQEIQIAMKFIREGVCDYIVKDEDLVLKVAGSIKKVVEFRKESEKLREIKKIYHKDLLRIAVLFISFCGLLAMFSG